MKAAEAAELIRAMGESLERDPEQFDFRVMVIGTQATSHGEGTALSATAFGGEPGSSAYGYVSSAEAGDIQIERGMAGAREAVLQSADFLRELAEAVDKNDKGRADLLLDRLQKGSAVPAAISTVASFAIKLAEVTG